MRFDDDHCLDFKASENFNFLKSQIREIKRLEFCANKLYTFVFLVDDYKFGY